MRAPPTGPLTFLFSDIEGSTRLWESLPEAMPAALGQHFDILGRVIGDAGGTVVKGTGDGVFAVFGDAPAAVGAAIEVQRELMTATWGPTGPLRVRMGLHTGTAIHDGGDYHGTDVHRCARVMSTAYGGQVIATETTFSLVRDHAPPGVSFIDLGEHRLKDLARAERIHQILHADLPTDFPPLRSLGSFPNNLPAALSSLIGRASELAAIQEALGRARLVTLTGAGGAGKTRLALQVAADRIERHGDGVWLVELAGLADPTLVAQAVVAALRAPELPGRPALDALTSYLGARDALIVVDNCEHLIASAADVVDHVLRAAPKVRVIATSREPLNVPGEIIWRVPSLSLTNVDGDPSLPPSEAVTLFVERARDADSGFVLTDVNRPTIEGICRRLDGLPLAIELAAARIRALSVDDIADRLSDRFMLLTGGARTALPRQRTLEAAVAWSYDLLDDDERRLFGRLSVFAGAFDLAAAEAVCAGESLERERIVDLLTRLVDKSLVSVVQVAGATRYRLLETLRDFARNRLTASNDAATVSDAHTRWVVTYAETAGRQMMGPDQIRWLDDIAATMDDIRAALARTIAVGDQETGLRMMVGLPIWWQVRAVREARHWLEQLLLDEAAISRRTLGLGLSLLGVALSIHGHMERAVGLQERALGILREVGDERGVAWALHYLGIGRWDSARPELSKDLTLAALDAFTEIGEMVGALRCLWWMVLWELEFGTVEAAMRNGARLDELATIVPGPIAMAHASEAAGLLARVRGDLADSRTRLLQAVGLHAQIGNAGCLSHCLEHVALVALDGGDAERAAIVLGTVDAIRDDVVGSAAVPPFERIWHEQATNAARTALGEGSFIAAWERGRAMRLDEAVAVGLAAVGPTSPA